MKTIAQVPLALALAIVASGCSNGGGTSERPDGTGGATASGGVGGATGGSAGAGGTSTSDCGDVTLASPLVVRTDFTAGLPAAAQGVLADGSYDLTRSEQEGASPDAGTRMSLQVRDSGQRVDAVRQVGSGAPERASYAVSYQGQELVMTQRCPADGLGKFEGYGYTATKEQLTLIRENFFLQFQVRK